MPVIAATQTHCDPNSYLYHRPLTDGRPGGEAETRFFPSPDLEVKTVSAVFFIYFFFNKAMRERKWDTFARNRAW